MPRKRTVSLIAALLMVAVAAGIGIAYSTWGGGSQDSDVAEAGLIKPALDLAEVNFITTVDTPRGEQDIAADHVVVFPDAEQYRVQMKPPPQDTIKPPHVLIDEYDSLRAAAESGNAEAAWRLYKALSQCEGAYTDEESLAEALETLHQTHTVVWPDGRSGSVSDPTQMDAYELLLTEPFQQCRGISASQKAESVDWLKKSAKDGNLRATLRLGEILGNSEEGLQAMQAAWLNGHVLGALRLSELYRNGYSDGEKLVKDDVAAHAHLYVFSQLMEPAFPASSRNAARFKAKTRADLQRSADGLHEHDLDLAMEQAKAILESNENCCYRIAR